MTTQRDRCLVSLSLVLAAAPSVARAQFFYPLPAGMGDQPVVSGDGSAVVGETYRWTLAGGGIQVPLVAKGINGDGTLVVGLDLLQPGTHGILWNVGGSSTPIGPLPGGTSSTACSISADGSVVVAIGNSSSGNRAFRWTTAGITIVPPFPGDSSSEARQISADGSVIVGLSGGPAGYRLFRWTQSTGTEEIPGFPPAPAENRANALNTNGSVIVGFTGTAQGYRAYRWTEKTGMVLLGVLGSHVNSYANAVSADGRTVVGSSDNFVPPYTNVKLLAFIWTPTLGMRDLNIYLPAVGINTEGWVLSNATGISADGLTIAGFGTLNGESRPWLAVLPPLCYANCDASTTPPILNIADFSCFINKFSAGDTYANCDQSTAPPILTVADFSCFLSTFAAGCS